MLLVKAADVLHRDADIQVVGARREDVLSRSGRLVGDDRIDGKVEEHRLQPFQQCLERFTRPQREFRATFLSRGGRGGERFRRALEHELSCGQVVVGAGVDPEELGVALNLGERLRIDVLRMRDDLLENVSHLEVVGVALVVENVAARERRLVEVPDERLFSKRELFEAIGVQLHDGGIVHAFEQILAIGRRGCDRRRLRAIR